MKTIKKTIILVLMTIVGISGTLKAQNPVFTCDIRNEVQTSATEYTFDIYLLWDGVSPAFEVGTFQAGFSYNQAGVKNGGTITASFVAGNSQMVAAQVPTAINVATANTIKIAPRGLPGAGSGTIISSVSPGTRVCTCKLTNTVAWTPGAQFNLTWIWPTAPYPTKVFAYVGGVSTQITGWTGAVYLNQGYHTLVGYNNVYLNAWNGLSSSDWSVAGNWSPSGVPTGATNVYVPASATLPQVTAVPASPATCNTLTIASGATLTINAGKALTASGATTNDGTLTIESSATAEGSYIDNGTIGGTGTFNVKRWVKSTASGSGWEYISSPIAAATADLFSNGTTRGLWYVDEPTSTWTAYYGVEGMTIGKGYARKYISTESDGDIAKVFTGSLNTGDLSINTTYSGPLSGSIGYNLLGNPYPSALDWDDVDWTKTNLDDAIYCRTNGNNFTSYVGGVGTNGGTKFIPPMQAFWVHANAAGSLGFHNTVRVHDDHNIYKASSQNTLSLQVANDANGFTDETVVRFIPLAADGFDGQYDAYKMYADDASYPQVYTNNSTDDISINSLSELTGERTVALGFNTTLSGQYTFTADKVSTFTENGYNVVLEDLLTKVSQDLSKNDTYKFTSDVTSGLNRFVLHFTKAATGIGENTNNQISIFGCSNEIHISSTNALHGDLTIYDILGQVVTSRHIAGENSAKFILDNKSAVYIVKYTTSENTITKRIFVNQ